MWPHASTEEAMEKICGPVSLRDYMAPLVSGLNNASNPVVPCHCNLELSSLEKKKIKSPFHLRSLVTDTFDGPAHEHVHIRVLRKELACGRVCT